MIRSTLIILIGLLALMLGVIGADEPKAKAADTPKPAAGEFPDSYYYYAEKRPATLRKLEGHAAPAITVKDWIGEPQKLADLKGKVVIVDFWATWCPPCRASLPHNVEMVKKYKDKGLVLIGIHDANRGSDKMPSMAKEKELNYPLSVDDGGASAKAYSVNFWPTYVVIDRNGIIRAAGLEPESVEKVVTKLLEEKAAATTKPAA